MWIVFALTSIDWIRPGYHDPLFSSSPVHLPLTLSPTLNGTSDIATALDLAVAVARDLAVVVALDLLARDLAVAVALDLLAVVARD